MIQYLKKNKLLQKTPVYGCNIVIMPNESLSVSLILLSKKKKEVSIEKQESFSSLDELFASMERKYPICLSIEGKGVLTQKTNDQGENPLNIVLPEGNSKEFYVKDYNLTATNRIIAFTRKEQVDSVLQLFRKNKLHVLEVHLNFGSLIPFTSMFGELELPNWKLSVIANELAFEKHKGNNKKALNILGTTLESEFIIPYCNALQFYLPSFFTESELKNNYIYNWHTSNLLKYSAIFLFAILLVNYFLFDRYSSEYNTLNTIYANNLSKTDQLSILKKDFQQKEEIIANAGLGKKSMLSFFIDRISATVPRNMQLKTLTLHPVADRIKEGKTIRFQNGIIAAGGIVNESQTFYKWIEELRILSFVEDVTIKNYFHEEDKGKGVFLIHVKISDKINVELPNSNK